METVPVPQIGGYHLCPLAALTTVVIRVTGLCPVIPDTLTAILSEANVDQAGAESVIRLENRCWLV